jgi:hypothetical protein
MKWIRFIPLLLLVLWPSAVWNQTTTATTEVTYSIVKVVLMEFTATADGWDSVATKTNFSGQVLQARIVPDTGAIVPSDSYDVAIYDPYGNDILLGHGANADSSSAVVMADSLGWVTGKLCGVVTNAGAGNKAKVYLWLR